MAKTSKTIFSSLRANRFYGMNHKISVKGQENLARER